MDENGERERGREGKGEGGREWRGKIKGSERER